MPAPDPATTRYDAQGYPLNPDGSRMFQDASYQKVSLAGDQQVTPLYPHGTADSNTYAIGPTVPAASPAGPATSGTPRQLYNTQTLPNQPKPAPTPLVGLDMTQPGAAEQWWTQNQGNYNSTYGAPLTQQTLQNYQTNGIPQGGNTQQGFYDTLMGSFGATNGAITGAINGAATSGTQSLATLQQGYLAGQSAANGALGAQRNGIAAIGAAGNSAALGLSNAQNGARAVGAQTSGMLGQQVNNVSAMNNNAAGVQQANFAAVQQNMQNMMAQETQALQQAYNNGTLSAANFAANLQRVQQSAQQSLADQMANRTMTQDNRNFAMFDANNQMHNLAAQGNNVDSQMAYELDMIRAQQSNSQVQYLNGINNLDARYNDMKGVYGAAQQSIDNDALAAYIDANQHREDQRVAGIRAVDSQQRSMGQVLNMGDKAFTAQQLGIDQLRSGKGEAVGGIQDALAKLGQAGQQSWTTGAAGLNDLFASRTQNLTREQDNLNRLIAQRPELQNDMGLDPYYQNAQRQSIEGINQNLAARGAYGSSAADDQIKETIQNLNADRANREAAYNLQRSAENRAWETEIGQQTGSLSGHQLSYDQLGQAGISDLLKTKSGYDLAGAGLSGDLGKLRLGYDQGISGAEGDLGKLYQGFGGIYAGMAGDLGNIRSSFANTDATMTGDLNRNRLGFAQAGAGLASNEAQTMQGFAGIRGDMINNMGQNALGFTNTGAQLSGVRANVAKDFAVQGSQAGIAKGQLGLGYDNLLGQLTNNIATNRLGYDTLQSNNVNNAETNRLGYSRALTDAAHGLSQTGLGFSTLQSNNANAYADNRLGFANSLNTATNNLANSNFNFANLDVSAANNLANSQFNFANLGERALDNLSGRTIANNTQSANERAGIAAQKFNYDKLGVDSNLALGDLGVRQGTLASNTAQGIDQNILNNNKFGLDYTQAMNNIAQTQDQGDLSRMIASQNAAAAAQRAQDTRFNSGFGANMKLADSISGVMGSTNKSIFGTDQDLLEKMLSAKVGVGSEALAGATRTTAQTRQDAQATQDQFAAAMKLFAANKGA
jgi:hypothetical protein